MFCIIDFNGLGFIFSVFKSFIVFGEGELGNTGIGSTGSGRDGGRRGDGGMEELTKNIIVLNIHIVLTSMNLTHPHYMIKFKSKQKMSK